MIHLEPAGEPKLVSSLEQAWQRVLKNPAIGFPALAAESDDWKAIENRAQSCSPRQNILILGIGGSSLGTQVIYNCFKPKARARCFFLESPDPHTWAAVKALDPVETHTVVISKSGNTLETLTWAERLHADNPAFLQPSRCTVIASPGQGPLQKWAQAANLATLQIPTNVGGRFSVLTAVGMFPARLIGLNIGEFREGAAWAMAHPGLSASLAAQILESWRREEWITQLWTYSEALRLGGEWWQQLWGESLAKRLDRAGEPAPRASTPMACAGPRDQHSLVQQLMEGARDKFVGIVRVRDVEKSGEKFKASVFSGGKEITLGQVLSAEAQAFSQSLSEVGIHHLTLTLDTLNEKSLGAYFMLWQMVIAQLGEHMQIDAFDQPGVELGKKYAVKYLG